MALEPGTHLGPYEIVELRGKGGMGEVYRARDTRLGRDVAVKVLPAELTGDDDYRRRLEREAKTISQLQHPNVCMLLDIGSEGSMQYMVMEYLEGETLEERLRQGFLPADDVVRIGREIAEAVEAAHREGVVHRDLKPGNVMLTRTGTKVLDFGLAREFSSPDDVIDTEAPTVPAITQEGAMVGTMPYMAPEQLQGGQVDSQADIWALGCILYEMATGARPFEGKNQADLIVAIMGSEPEPPTSRQPLAPQRLDGIVKRCLEKDPMNRWPSAHDVAVELGSDLSVSAGGASIAKPTRPAPQRWLIAAIALLLAGVAGWWFLQPRGANEADGRLAGLIGSPSGHAFVPFENASGDAELDGLAVAIRENTMARRATDARPLALLDPAAVGNDGLCSTAEGRRWVWQGSVSRLQSRIKVNARIISCPEEAVRWSEAYDFEHSDLVVIADEVASRMMTESQQTTAQDSGTPGSVRWYMTRRTPESNTEGLALVRQALPENPSLSQGLFRLLLQALFEGYGDAARNLEEMRALAETMRTADPNNRFAHVAGAWGGVFAGDRELMLLGFERALELSGLPADHHLLAGALTYVGRHDEALEHIEKAFSLSPSDAARVRWYQRASLAHFAAGRYEQARDAALEGVKLRTNDLFNGEADAYQCLAASYAHLGEIEEARDALQMAMVLRPTLDSRVALTPFATADQDLRDRYLEGLRLAGLQE